MYSTVNMFKNTFYCQEIQIESSNYFTQLPQTTNLLSMSALTIYIVIHSHLHRATPDKEPQSTPPTFPQMYTEPHHVQSKNLNPYAL